METERQREIKTVKWVIVDKYKDSERQSQEASNLCLPD